jgi:stage V sporulation protein G
MKVEVVRLHRLENGGAIKAFADIQIDDMYIVKGFKVIEGKDGLFVGMPSEVGKSGKWFSTFEPLTDEAKTIIEEAIIKAYEE